MDVNILSPYVRLAIHSTIASPFVISRRIIYDYELIFIKDGVCRIQIDGTDYMCRKNSVVFLRPGVHHSFHSVENVDFVQPHIHFDAIYSKNSTITPISFKPFEGMSEEERQLVCEDVFADVEIPCLFRPENPALFQKLFFDVIEMYSAGASQIELKIAMLKVLSLLLLQFDTPKDGKRDKAALIDNIKSYIDENYRNIITLDLLADAFYINKFTLMRKFTDAYGMNVIKYYNRKRIEYAKKMIKNTNLSIKQIGEMLSFADAYSFSRFFKNAVGVSPAGYRKSGCDFGKFDCNS